LVLRDQREKLIKRAFTKEKQDYAAY
jgi:hypothetical protein